MSCYYDVPCPDGCTGTVDPLNPWSTTKGAGTRGAAGRLAATRTELAELIRVTLGKQSKEIYQASSKINRQKGWLA